MNLKNSEMIRNSFTNKSSSGSGGLRSAFNGMTVCLYSKYSPRCVDFFTDMVYLRGVKMLCIDNQEIRRVIEEDACHYGVFEVPCILVFYQNGRLDKYEGDDAFSWLQDKKHRTIMSSRLLSSALSSDLDKDRIPTLPTSSSSYSDHLSTESVVSMDSGNSSNSSLLPIEREGRVDVSDPVTAQQQRQLQLQSQQSQMAPQQQQQQQQQQSQDPHVPAPGDPRMVDISEEEKYATETKSTVLKKRENIMAMAASMAKQRESEFEANDPKKRISPIS
jgi:hypothetical protein